MNISKHFSLLLTIVFSCILLWVYYAFVFKSTETIFFSCRNGDGAKEYFSSIYHHKYDSGYFHCSSMNYPFGEELKFFGVQSIPINVIKFINVHTGWLNENTIVWYINLSMVLSLLVSSIFIHLILEKLLLPWWIIIMFATPIAFASPQLERFNEHFALGITCFIPIAIYLLLIFHEKRSVWISILIAAVYFYVYEIHAYFFLMIATFSLIYFMYVFVKEKKSLANNAMHFSIQLIMPFSLVFILDSLFVTITDRTGYPWGHMFYLSTPESVFLPVSRDYFSTIATYLFRSTTYISWEGRAFAGYLVIFIVLLIIMKAVFKKDLKLFVKPTSNNSFNAMIVAAMLLLLFSFGLPYILNLESLVQYSGPVKQLRALGRFSWPFYYIFNILAVYYIYHSFHGKASYVICGVLFFIVFADLNYANRQKKDQLNHHWDNYKSLDPANGYYQISNRINIKDYSSILPLPFYSIGSENINVEERCQAVAMSYALSLRTGLPLIGTISSRLSFQQAYEMQQIYYEPYRRNIIWDHIYEKCNKPILIMVPECDLLSPGERTIIMHSTLLFKQDSITLYSFDPRNAHFMTDSLYHQQLSSHAEVPIQELKDEEWQHGFYFKNFYKEDGTGYLNTGSKRIDIGKEIAFDSIIVPSTVSSSYIAAFWFSDIYKDVLPRGKIIIKAYDSTSTSQEIYSAYLSSNVKIIEQQWALFEDTIHIPARTKRLVFYSKNKELTKGKLSIDNILIRRKGQDIYFSHPKGIVKNNRLYIK